MYERNPNDADASRDKLESVLEELNIDPMHRQGIRERQSEMGCSYAEAAHSLGLGESCPSETTKHSFDTSLDASDQDHDAPADDGEEALKAVLATLSKGESIRRTPQRIVVSGVGTGLAASRIASGLAATCARNGFRALLVDANLGKGSVHTQFGIENDEGLSTLLQGTGSPHRFPQSTGIPNLAVIPSGPRVPNHSGLLARQRLFHRLEPIAHHFDYIVADAAALTPTLLARASAGADNIIITVREHVSSMRELASLVRTMRAEGASEPVVLMIE